jgi:hypothetical protein
MDDIVQRAQFGNMYDWVHKEYFGYFKDMTYVETTDDAICVIRHRYNIQSNSETSTHIISFTSGTLDRATKTMCLHPSYVINVFQPEDYFINTNDDYSHNVFAGYQVQVSFDVPRNHDIIRECMKHATIGIQQKKIIQSRM